MTIDRALVISLFAGYTGKLLVLGASPSDAAVVLILAAAHFLYNSQIQSKEVKALSDKFDALKSSIAEQNRVIEDTRAAMSSIKLGQGLRPAK